MSYALQCNSEPIELDSAGDVTMGWNSGTAHIEISGGPLAVSTAIYGNDAPSPLAPVATPGVWNVFSRVVYSDGGTTQDTNPNTAGYDQLLKYGTRVANLWGRVIEARDLTGNPSSLSGVLQTLELDMFVNGADDYAAQIGRTVLSMVFGQNNTSGAAAVISGGISMNVPPGHTVSLVNPIRVSVPFSACGIDFHTATPASGALLFWGCDNAPIALNTAGTATVRWDTSTNRVKVAYNGEDVMSVDTSGNVRCRGVLTQRTTP